MMQLTEQEKKQLEKVRQAKFDILFTTSDSNGNFLVFNQGQLYMRNDGEDRNRKIGSIYYIGDTILYTKYELEKHVFRKMDAWSIPLLVAKNVDVICFKNGKKEWWITQDTIRELVNNKRAAILQFEGYEKKVYIPRSYWQSDPIIKDQFEMTLLAGYTPVKQKANMEKSIARVGKEWAEKLNDYFETEAMKKLGKGIHDARKAGKIIYPPSAHIFRAFKETSYDQVKVVLLGQDPYHDGNSTGLAFDCGLKITPSMRKINEGYTEQFPSHFSTDIMEGKLIRWATEGVFLLNTALTVREKAPGSHLKHWSPFIQHVILTLNARVNEKMPPVVWMLWGKMAQQYKKLISPDSPIIEAEHPSACLYNGSGKWQHQNCFIKANNELRNLKVKEIIW